MTARTAGGMGVGVKVGVIVGIGVGVKVGVGPGVRVGVAVRMIAGTGVDVSVDVGMLGGKVGVKTGTVVGVGVSGTTVRVGEGTTSEGVGAEPRQLKVNPPHVPTAKTAMVITIDNMCLQGPRMSS